MKRSELYHKTVDILVQAYFNDTLVIGDWCGCAVGNIIAANLGLKIIKVEGYEMAWENHQIGTITDGYLWWDALTWNITRSPIATQQIDASGYSLQEIYKIEKAFESNAYGGIED